MQTKDLNRLKLYNKTYRLKNKERISLKRKEYYLANKEKIKKKRKDYYYNKTKNTETQKRREILEYKRKLMIKGLKQCQKCFKIKKLEDFYKSKRNVKSGNKTIIRGRCIPCFAESTKKWKLHNRERVNENARKNYHKNNRVLDFKNDLNGIKTINYLRKRLGDVIKKNNFNKKKNRTLEYVGCNKEQLLEHLYSTIPKDATWQDFLNGKLHIDHIIPFNYYIKECGGLNEENIYKVMNYKNLQFLWAKDNLMKSGKY